MAIRRTALTFTVLLCLAVWAGPGVANNESTTPELGETETKSKQGAVAQDSNVQQIFFDAATYDWKDVPKELSANQEVQVVICRPNTFREKYTVTVQTTDFHTGGIPAALAGIIVSAPPKVSEEAPLILEWSSLTQAFNDYKAAHEDFEKLLEGVPTAGAIADIIRKGEANCDIRRDVANKIHSGLGYSDEVAESLGKNEREPTKLEAAIGNIKEALGPAGCGTVIPREGGIAKLSIDPSDLDIVADALTAQANGAKDQRDKLETLRKGWLLAWQQTYPTFGSQPSSGQDFERNQWVTKTYQEAQARVKHLYVVRDLYSDFFLNPEVFPSHILTTAKKLDADEATISVKVERALSPVLVTKEKPEEDPLKALLYGGAAGPSGPYTITRPVYGRWVRDFSAGAVWTALRQKSYFIETLEDESKVIREGDSSPDWGLGVLMHRYRTQKVGHSDGYCFGVSTGDPLRYLAGYTHAWYSPNSLRWYLSGGLALGKVTELNGDVVGNPPVSASSPLTRTEYQGDWFAAATVSFGF